jgi:hypothetical protein
VWDTLMIMLFCGSSVCLGFFLRSRFLRKRNRFECVINRPGEFRRSGRLRWTHVEVTAEPGLLTMRRRANSFGIRTRLGDPESIRVLSVGVPAGKRTDLRDFWVIGPRTQIAELETRAGTLTLTAQDKIGLRTVVTALTP